MEDAVFLQLERGGENGFHGTIPLEPMTQQMEVRVQDDDWTGISNPAERRRLQNRLHQRLWRKRHGSKLTWNKPGPKHLGRKFQEKESESTLAENQRAARAIEMVAELEPTSKALAVRPPTSICNLDPTDTQKIVEQFESWYRYHMAGPPSADHLLHLVQFNVFRALMSNTFALGFTTEWLSEDAVSPFNTMTLEGGGLARTYPATLRPTKFQHAVKHHPWIDLFPMPAFRDNLLRADGTYDEDQLCADLVEFCNVPGEMGGLLVWGEPSNQHCWEVSEQFAKKWSWALKGCHELLTSTNYWRSKRGDKKLLIGV